MKHILESQEKTLDSIEQAREFFELQANSDTWRRLNIAELEIIPVPGNGVAIFTPDAIRSDANFHADVSDESIMECFNETKVGVGIPFDHGYDFFPLSSSGYSSLISRCGWGKNPPVLTCDKEKAHQTPLSPVNRALAFNLGKECFSNNVLVLVRDEKVRAVHSGDESDYAVLLMKDLIAVLEEELTIMYSKYSFSGASASHDFSVISFKINDQNVKNDICSVFSKVGITVQGDPVIRLVTSDTAVSGANLYVILRATDGREMMFGTPLGLTHANKHTVDDFRKNAQQITSMFRDAKEKLQKMSQTKVKHPDGCIRYIAIQKCGFPKKYVAQVVDDFISVHLTATQLDVYKALYDILDEYSNDSDISTNRMMQLQENIARTCFINMSDYDMPYNIQ